MSLPQSRNVGNDGYIIMCNFGGRIKMKLKAFNLFFLLCLVVLACCDGEGVYNFLNGLTKTRNSFLFLLLTFNIHLIICPEGPKKIRQFLEFIS